MLVSETFKARNHRKQSVMAGSDPAVVVAVSNMNLSHKAQFLFKQSSLIPSMLFYFFFFLNINKIMSSYEEQLLLILALQSENKKIRCWVHDINKREELGYTDALVPIALKNLIFGKNFKYKKM